jgi:putative protease
MRWARGVGKMADGKVGTVVYFFDKICVAAVELTNDVTVGDYIRFVRRGQVLFEQKISSMQIEHDPVAAARAGQSIGLRTNEKVREGTRVYRVERPDPTGL